MDNTPTPLLFGESRQPLYGVYYGTTSSLETGRAALLCPPIGHEYMRSYMTLDKLARRLASRGWPALKFDYLATGDSVGATGDGNCDAWRKSIALAGSELLERSEARTLLVVGMRLGATLAASLPSDALPIEVLVGWDPVVVGADYLADLQALHESSLALLHTGWRRADAVARNDELIGFDYPEAMRDSIAAMDMRQSLSGFRGRAFLVSSSECRDAERCREIAAAAGDCMVEVVPDACEWDEPNKINDAVLASALPTRIVDYLETLPR